MTHLLRLPDYRRIWLAGLFSGVIRWLELLAFGLYATQLTGSPFLVALLALLRFAPMALFGLAMGAAADIANPKAMLVWGMAAMVAFSGAMALLFSFGDPAYWHIALAAFVSGVFWAGDLPVRRKVMAEALADDRLAAGMALDNASSNGTRAVGPLIGGLVYAGIGIAGVFVLGAVLYGVCLWATIRVSYNGAPAEGPRAPWRKVKEALSFARASRDVRMILLVTVFFNLWGFPMLSMVPVLGGDFALTPQTIGAITALEGAMAFTAALLVAAFARPAGFRRLYFWAVTAEFVAVLLAGLAGSPLILCAALALAGLAAGGFAPMQSTLIYRAAPAPMRGRLMGLMTLCIGTGVIGFANVGLTAELFGARTALLILAAQGLAAMTWAWFHWPELHEQG